MPEVNTADVLEFLSPILHVKAATVREVRRRIRPVLEWAIALPGKDVAAAIETVRTSNSG